MAFKSKFLSGAGKRHLHGLNGCMLALSQCNSVKLALSQCPTNTPALHLFWGTQMQGHLDRKLEKNTGRLAQERIQQNVFKI